MFFSRKNVDTPEYPDVPDSLRTESFEMTGMRKTQEARADTAPYITPYLSLRSRLSQIWINRWTILLILVLVRVVLLIAQLNDNIGDAETKALSACSKVEDIGSAVASMPHYLSAGVNDLTATGVEKAVDGMVKMLDLVIQGVEGIIIFYINFLTATYTCLLTALIHGSLDVVVSVTGDATDAFNKIVDKATDEIKSIAGDLQKAVNKIADGINDSIIGDFVPDIPDVDFSKPIKDLKGFSIHSGDFVKDVRALNGKIPTFKEVQNLTEEAISIPFDLVRKALNDSYGGYKFPGKFPLAQKEQLTFCSGNDTLSDFFKHLFELVAKAKIIFIVVLAVLAVAAIAPMAWIEIRRWRKQQKIASLIAKNQYDSMDIVYIASRPLTATAGIKIASRFRGKRQILVRWCIAYATSIPAIFVLSLALAGFFSCLCQFILLSAVKSQVPALSNEVGNFADDVVSSLQNVSEKWAGDANGVIKGLNDEINDDVLGYVTNATDAVNDTITEFLDTMEDGLDSVFKDTILLDAIKTVLYCTVGIKIESVQKGLTWVHDHAKVDLPLFDSNIFSLGANESITGDSELNTFLASPSSVTTDEVTGAVTHVTDWLHSNLVQEALISTGLLLVYVIIVLIGVLRTLSGMAMPDRNRGEGGMRYTGDDRAGHSPRTNQYGNHSEAVGAFPRFGSDSTEPEAYGANGGASAEKYVAGTRSARPRQVPGHTRESSYGDVDSGGKF